MTEDDPKETPAIRNPLNDYKRLLGYPTPKTAVLMLTVFIAMMAMFLTYTGWVVGSRPISEIEHFELDNTPPPESARSFSINHGIAVYYEDGVPSDHPTKRNVIVGVFFGLYTALLAMIFVSRHKAKQKGISLARDP